MEESKEFNHLDALFREAFENLPDTPSSSGWDKPSEQVWANIQAHLQTPTSGKKWSRSYTFLLTAVLGIAVLVGFAYWLLEKPAPPEVPMQETIPSKEMAAPPMTAPLSVEEEAALQQQQVLLSRERTLRRSHPSRGEEPATLEQDILSSKPLPGSVPAPNTTIWRQLEELRLAPWAQPLQPLPQRSPQLLFRHLPTAEDLLRANGRSSH